MRLAPGLRPAALALAGRDGRRLVLLLLLVWLLTRRQAEKEAAGPLSRLCDGGLPHGGGLYALGLECSSKAPTCATWR